MSGGGRAGGPGRAGLALDGAFVLVGAAIAVAAAWPVYGHPWMLVAGAVGAVLGVAIALAGRAFGLPWWADALAAVAAYLLAAVPLAVPGSFPDRLLDGLGAAVAGVVVGWKQLVTLELPLGTYQAVLVPLLVVTLFGSYAAMRLAGAGRAAGVFAPAVLAAMVAFGIAFGTSRLDAPYAPGRLVDLPLVGTPTVGGVLVTASVALVLATLAWLSLRARRERRAAIAAAAGVSTSQVAVRRAPLTALARRGALGAGMLAAALAVGAAVAIPASAAHREVLRDRVAPLELTTAMSSPLSTYRAWLTDERYDAELFTVRADADVGLLRFSVMDVYDGVRFTVAESQSGARFARSAGMESTGSRATIVFGDAYDEPWVPLPGDVAGEVLFPAGDDRAVAMADAVYYADDDGAAVMVADAGDGVGFRAGDEVVSSGAVVADGRRLVAAASGGQALHTDVLDDATFPELSAWVAAQDAPGGGEGLLLLIDRLRERGYLSHDLLDDPDAAWRRDLASRVDGYAFETSRAGHSASRLEALFAALNDRAAEVPSGEADPVRLVAAVGDDEQFAAAAALIAWSRGFEARVAVGVRLGDAGEQAVASSVEPCAGADGVYVCEGRNVTAWVEVAVGGVWVPIETSPQVETAPVEELEGTDPPQHGSAPERPSTSIMDPPDPERADAEPDQGREEDAPAAPSSRALAAALGLVGVVASGLGLLLAPALLVAAAKALRRARRRALPAEAAIVGAWEEYVDGCVDAGRLPVDAGGTRAQLAARIGRPAAARLAARADEAVFGPVSPSVQDAAAAWQEVDDERRAFGREAPLRVRLFGALRPASMLRHVRRTSTRATIEAGSGATR